MIISNVSRPSSLSRGNLRVSSIFLRAWPVLRLRLKSRSIRTIVISTYRYTHVGVTTMPSGSLRGSLRSTAGAGCSLVMDFPWQWWCGEPGLDLVTDQEVFHRFFRLFQPLPLPSHPFSTLFPHHISHVSSDPGSRRISAGHCRGSQDQKHLQMREWGENEHDFLHIRLQSAGNRSTAPGRRLLAIKRNLEQSQ